MPVLSLKPQNSTTIPSLVIALFVEELQNNFDTFLESIYENRACSLANKRYID